MIFFYTYIIRSLINLKKYQGIYIIYQYFYYLKVNESERKKKILNELFDK